MLAFPLQQHKRAKSNIAAAGAVDRGCFYVFLVVFGCFYVFLVVFGGFYVFLDLVGGGFSE